MASRDLALALVAAAALAAPVHAQDGAASRAAVEKLVDELAADDAKARAEAAKKLGAAYPEGAAAAECLLELVTDRKGAVRSAAQAAITELASEGLGDIATYLDRLRTDKTERELWGEVGRQVRSLGTALTPKDIAYPITSALGTGGGTAKPALARVVLVLSTSARLRGSSNGAQVRAAVTSATRAQDPRTRRLALACLAVLGREALVQRRCDGYADATPALGDVPAVPRLLALLDPKKTPDEGLRASFDHHVPLLLGWSCGHAGEDFRALLGARMDEKAFFLALNRLDRSGLSSDAPSATAQLERLTSSHPDELGDAIAALSIRRDAAEPLLPRIRAVMQAGDLHRKLAAGLAVLQLSPGDPEAGPLVMESYKELFISAPEDLRAEIQLRKMKRVATEWMGRMPSPPAALAERLWISMPTDDPLMAEQVALAMPASLSRNPQLQRYLNKHYFPDEGEPDRPIAGPGALQALGVAIGLAGAAPPRLVADWTKLLEEQREVDSAARVVDLGPAALYVAPAEVLRLLLRTGPRAEAALPAIEPYLESEDLLERYMARRAVLEINVE